MSNFSFTLMAESIQVIFLLTFKTPLCCVLMAIELLVKSWKYRRFCKRCPETSTFDAIVVPSIIAQNYDWTVAHSQSLALQTLNCAH